jgi:hypothetical protein
VCIGCVRQCRAALKLENSEQTQAENSDQKLSTVAKLRLRAVSEDVNWMYSEFLQICAEHSVIPIHMFTFLSQNL